MITVCRNAVFSLCYPACKARAPYCHRWPGGIYHIFSTLSHTRYDFRGSIKMCFSLQLLSATFLMLRRIQRNMCVFFYLCRSGYTTRVSPIGISRDVYIYLFTAIGLLPGGRGYFTCEQNMKLVTTKFKSGGLHEKHVVATWNVGNRLSICL